MTLAFIGIASSLDGVQRNPGLRITLVFHFCYVIGGNGQYGFDAPYSATAYGVTGTAYGVTGRAVGWGEVTNPNVFG